MSATLDDLSEQVQGLRTLMENFAVLLAPGAQSRPLKAVELMVRWGITGKTREAQLENLWKRCRLWGLEPMRGTRGLSATYMLADVLAAEGVGNGTLNRRRKAK